MKNLFDYVFDLDLLGHVHRDALQVARKLLGGSDSPELEHYIELEHQKLKIEKEIKAHEDALSISKKKLKTLQLEVQKLETKIRNHSKKVKELHKDKDVKIAHLTQRLQIFKTLIMYELPLLLNPSLIKGLQERAHSPVKLNDEKMFASHFQRFLEAIDSQANPDEAIKIFKKLLLTESSPIELSMERKNFSALLEELKNLQFEIKQLDEAIYDAESNDVKVNVVKALRRELLGKKKQEEADNATMSTLLHQIDISQAQLKDVNREMTKIYNQNQEKFALIKGYEELQEISTVANIVYHEELAEKLDAFNRTLTKNTASFLKQYKHIRKIYLDEKYRIVITDGQQKLKTDLLSAGQKQVLNFLIVKSILEYKDLASFVMVDTPFGRLSNANKKLLLEECYLQFDHLVLLLTDSEFEFVQAQNLRYTTYNIVRNDSGSQIEVAS
jgi:DNA sulfur modification protein DndD